LAVGAARRGALLYVDDVPAGSLPVALRVAAGRHVLRIEAPAHRAWGAVIDAWEGRRAPIDVALSPEPVVTDAEHLVRDADRLALPAVPRRLRALVDRAVALDALWVAVVGSGEQDRALLVACTAAGCRAPRRIEVDEIPIVLGRGDPIETAELGLALDAAVAWLDEPAPVVVTPPPPPIYERWWFWTAAGALALGAAGTTAWLTRPDPERDVTITVDFGPGVAP
jgi:hypothetical protein